MIIEIDPSKAKSKTEANRLAKRKEMLIKRYGLCEDCGELKEANRSSSAKYCKGCSNVRKIKQSRLGNERLAMRLYNRRQTHREDITKERNARKQTIVDIVELMERVHSPILFEKFSEKHKVSQRCFRNYANELCEAGKIEKEGELTGRYYKAIEVMQ